MRMINKCPECKYVGDNFEFSSGRPACYMDCPKCKREVRAIDASERELSEFKNEIEGPIKGSWFVEFCDDDPYGDIKVKAEKHRTVCRLGLDDAPVHDYNLEQEMYARKIAQLPEILRVLKIITRDLEDAQKHMPTEDKIFTNSSIKLAMKHLEDR